MELARSLGSYGDVVSMLTRQNGKRVALVYVGVFQRMRRNRRINVT